MDVQEDETLADGLQAETQFLRPGRRYRAWPTPSSGCASSIRKSSVVVITSLKPRIFCAGANIYMLGTSSHAFKVNFCKFTNETRCAIEDDSRHSGEALRRRAEWNSVRRWL